MASLESITSTSPVRNISWKSTDSQGNQTLDANGQAVSTSLIPQVVVEERHFDQLRSTKHPIEQGAQITDHAYKEPPQLMIRAGWSFAAASSASSTTSSTTDVNYLRNLYATLLSIQEQRVLVSIVTGKRDYDDMLLESLTAITDEKTENTLIFTATFEQKFFAKTQTVTVPSASVMKTASSNAATTDLGSTSLSTGGAINLTAANASLPSSLQGATP